MREKYGVLDCDFYNFDETGFMWELFVQQWLLHVPIVVAEARQFSLAVGNGQQRLLVLVVRVGMCLHS